MSNNGELYFQFVSVRTDREIPFAKGSSWQILLKKSASDSTSEKYVPEIEI
ncbi:Unknown protein sequence [Pseudomonas amygdali pv. morsprunorum]|nr:Unknown protein sequence [Pseudomonas amygdali pv. morsprunorum]